MIPSVNFHLWEPCNMRCKFCFATFQDVKRTILPAGHLPKEQAIEVVIQLAEIGFEKITFAGGEPTLCPWLPDLISTAKDANLTTMIVSNGSQLTDTFLEKNKNKLDWIAISIDSLNDETNLVTGRAIAGNKPLKIDYYLSLVDRIKQYGYGLKINTVVHSKNFKEDMSVFIRYAKPKRWKVMQVLPIEGQNDLKIDNLIISESQFQFFLDTHNGLKNITNIVPELNSDMKGSYVMVDPAGRFFDNTTGTHNYSKSILEIGSRLAIQQVNYDFSKFVSRGGIYDWQIEKNHIPVRITLSGEVASGKSTIGKLLADKLNYSFTSIGERTRSFAAQRCNSITEFQKECLLNPELDKQLDRQFSDECNAKEDLVIDYRLGFRFIQSAFHIFLKVSEETAIKRLQKANRQNETYHTLRERNASFKQQFINTYGIYFTEESNYDLILNVDNKVPEEIVEEILCRIKKIHPLEDSKNGSLRSP